MKEALSLLWEIRNGWTTRWRNGMERTIYNDQNIKICKCRLPVPKRCKLGWGEEWDFLVIPRALWSTAVGVGNVMLTKKTGQVIHIQFLDWHLKSSPGRYMLRCWWWPKNIALSLICVFKSVWPISTVANQTIISASFSF